MNTQIVKIEKIEGHISDIENAASIIKSGGLVVIPTETVYGLGGDGTNPLSSKKIYEAKGRDYSLGINVISLARLIGKSALCNTE